MPLEKNKPPQPNQPLISLIPATYFSIAKKEPLWDLHCASATMTTGFVPTDRKFNNLTVRERGGQTVSTKAFVTQAVLGQLSIPGGVQGDVLVNVGDDVAGWSNQLTRTSTNTQQHSTNIQNQVQFNSALTSHVHALTNYVAAATPVPTPAVGRTITFTNNTAATTLDLYVTEGYPVPTPVTYLTTLAPTAPYVWPIPEVLGWNGNFSATRTGVAPLPGATLMEFGLNQLWPDIGCLRDTFDLSTVPPGLGTQLADGPHSACVALSAANGYSTQQSRGYNVGVTLTPPVLPPQPCTPTTLPTQPVTCNSLDGDSAGSVGFPNDTFFPKQQTGYAQGNYLVSLIDPVA